MHCEVKIFNLPIVKKLIIAKFRIPFNNQKYLYLSQGEHSAIFYSCDLEQTQKVNKVAVMKHAILVLVINY